MPSKIRDIADILGVTEADNPSNTSLAIQGEMSGFQKTYSYTGNLSVNTGTERFYTFDSATCSEINTYVGTAPVGSAITFNVKKNGATVDTVSIGDGNTSSLNSSTTLYNKGDYLTVDITQVGLSTAGSDLKINFTFTKV